MKRILFFGFAFLMFFLASLVFVKFVKQLNIKNRIVEQMVSIPQFEFLTLDSTLFTNDSLYPWETVIFIHFNTNCDYCIYETEQLVLFAEQIKSARVLLISEEDLCQIKKFREELNLERFPFIELLKDPGNLYYNYFGTAMMPSIILYSKKGFLIKEFKGETKIETLLKYINQDNPPFS